MKSIRSLYWPGFVLGMLLMTGISCAGLAMLLGINELTLLDIQASGEAAWLPPPPTATEDVAVAEVPRVEEASAYAFRVGDIVRNVTSTRVNIRRSPGHQGKGGDDILAQIQPGEGVEIVSGPQEADSLLWWLIRYRTQSGATVEGWMAEATGSGVTIMAP